MNDKKKTISISDRKIGQGHPAFIIGEIGSCHDGKLEQAKKLIDVVVEGGADAVKFQIFTAEGLYTSSDPRYKIVKPFEMPREWILELALYSKSKGVLFSASPFDIEAVNLLVQSGTAFIKIASPEIRDFPLMEYCAQTGLPLIISTGVSTLADVERALYYVNKSGATDVALLHCTSIVPTEPENVNLRAIMTLRQAFDIPVGLSDHTMNIAIPAAAIALGACIIEKHVTLDRSLVGPDHPFSLTPTEFKDMVNAIRDVEAALGSPIKRIIAGKERPDLHEKSIVVKVKMDAGEIITADKLVVKRAPRGIESQFFNKVIGNTTRKEIAPDTILTWNLIEKNNN